MIYFILGMVTVQFLFPLGEGVCGVLLTGLEALKGYFSVKVAKYNAQLRKLSEPTAQDMNQIGF